MSSGTRSSGNRQGRSRRLTDSYSDDDQHNPEVDAGSSLLRSATMITLYAIIPAIVRSLIAKAELNFNSINITQASATGFRLQAQMVLSKTGAIPATIVPPLVIHIDDVGTVTNNEPIKIVGGSSGSTVASLDCPFVIDNMDAFNRFTHDLIFQKNVVWNLKAQATIQPISGSFLSYSNIPLDKNITLNAFNGLTNVSIGAIDLSRSNTTHVLIDTNITIQNPSLFSIELGRLFFSLQYNNQTIGYVESVSGNTTLRPGTNDIPFFGELQKTSNESYNAISAVIQNFLTNRISNVTALAGPNCTSYPLFATGMAGLTLGVQMPPFDKPLIASLSFGSMSLIPSIEDKSVILSASINISINSPLGTQSPLYLTKMDMNAALVYKNNSVGSLNVIGADVIKINSTEYQTSFEDKILLLEGDGSTYEKFAQDFIRANDANPISFSIDGLASVTGEFALGPLKVSGIHVNNTVSLGGLDGLNDVHVDEISVEGEEGNTLRLSIKATIGNPGMTTVKLEHFTLTMADGVTGTVMGRVPVDVLAVSPGKNTVQLKGYLAPRPEDLSVVGNFFSAYLGGITQSVTLYHNETTIANATATDLTISGLTLKSNLSGIHADLIQNVTILDFGIEFDPNDVNRVYVSGRLSVLFVLPSNVNMTFKALTTSINFTMRNTDGAAMGRISLFDLPVEHNQTTNVLTISFKKQELIVVNTTVFEEFAANLVLTTNATISIDGSASALAQVAIGNLTLIGIPLNQTISLAGYNQFDGGNLQIGKIDIAESLSSQALSLRVKTEIENPSVVNIINAGRLTLDLCDNSSGTSLGLVEIYPFFLAPQGNTTVLTADGLFNMTENNTRISREFISNMISGLNNTVELRGTLEDNSTGTSIPLLSLAIGRLRIHSDVPGLTGSNALVQELLVKRLTAAEIAGITIGLVKVLEARIRMVNPFNTSLTIRSIDVKVDYGDKINDDLQVGLVHDQANLNVGPYEDFTSPYVNVTIAAKLTTLATMIVPLLEGHARLSLYGTIDFTIGDDFTLNNLPVSLLNITTKQEPKY